MPAVISWLLGTVTRWVGGNTTKAASIVSWFGLILVIGGMAGTGWLVHRYDAAQHRAEISEIKAAAAQAQAKATDKARDEERRNAALTQSLEEAYAQLALAREDAAVESADLSGRLTAALNRLRHYERAGGDGHRVPGTGNGVERCADVQNALDRSTRALELLKAAGDQVARDGQHGVDVATIAAAAARAAEVKPEGR